MKKFIKFLATLSIIMLPVACNEIENVGFNTESVLGKQTTSYNHDVKVTLNEAIEIANMFVCSNAGNNKMLTKSIDESTKTIRSTETIRENEQNLMYVFNYEGGGFVIVGSTRNYYPILAYSDEGSFVLKEDMEAVDVWLDETKVCIKNSSSLSDDTKAQMQNLWARYDGTYVDPTPELLTARRPQTRSTGEDACWEEIEDLQALHGSEGWTFLPLSQVEDIFEDAGLSSEYANLCYSATQNHSALNETVIGYKVLNTNQVNGPLLETTWDQSEPFDYLCSPNKPGCGAIAVAQVMYYYQYPPIMSWDGVFFDWDDIPWYMDFDSEQPRLIRMVGQAINMQYGTSFSWTVPSDVVSGLNVLGYSSYRASHNKITVRDAILNSSKPVIMVGNYVNLSGVPEPANLAIGGHYWVCDGAHEIISNQMHYYTENQPYGAGNFTQGMYSYSAPGVSGGTVTRYFYMNWGHDNEFLHHYNGWYLEDAVDSGVANFQYSRQDIFVTAP